MSTKTSSKCRYHPAAEFDDVTLARKREYWRSKKREQRARKSSAKTKIKNENLGLCVSIVSDEQIPNIFKNPSLHNNDISIKQEGSPKISGVSVSKSNVTNVPCQKEGWFQKTKLNHVLPQFNVTSTSSFKGVMSNKKSSVTGSSNIDVKTESLTPHSLPTTFIELHPKSAQTKTGMSFINGKQCHGSMFLPINSNQNKSQNCLQLLTFAKCKAHEDQSFIRRPVTKKKTCAFASEHNTRVAMTEEEIAAKRRENWRIKKREQRAKHAAKLAWGRQGNLRQGQPSSALSHVNNKALRGVSLNSVTPIFLNHQSLGSKKFFGSWTQQHVQGTKPNSACLSSGILQPPLGTTQTLNKSKVPKITHTQKKRQKQIRKSVQGALKVESPEERHAKKKEYWRTKKREQRARLSMAVKAQLKEREQLKLCRKHFHSSLNQTNGVKVSKPSPFASSSETLGGFIKDDGISKITPKHSLPASQNFSSTNCIGKVKPQVQVSSPLYSDAQPVTRLLTNNFINAHQNSLVKSSLAKRAVMGSMTVTIQSKTLTEEERIARLREYWRIKKREQRASRAARLGNGLLRSKVLVLKQREQNKKANQRCSVTSSIDTTVCDSPTPVKEEHIYPTIQAVFSIPEITPCISVKDGKPSLSPSIESRIEPTAVDHHATTLQAVTSMKKLLVESVCIMRDQSLVEQNSVKMHVKSENEPIPLMKDDLLSSEDAKPNVTLQQDVLLREVSDIKLESPPTSTFKDTSHSQEAADGRPGLSSVAVQTQRRSPQKFSSDGTDPKQFCSSQALQKQQVSERDELQRKREYWRLMKRQQRARNTKKEADKDAVLCSLAPQTTQEKKPRQIPIQEKTRSCPKPAGAQPQPRTNRSQIEAKPNSQEDPEEVIRRRRMQWRIKKQEQRARKAANQRKLPQMMAPPQRQTSQEFRPPHSRFPPPGSSKGQNTPSLGPPAIQSMKTKDQLCYTAEPCQTALKEEPSFAPNDAAEGALSQAEWRSFYLMDFDPVSQLLVCMVCGEQQYSVSVEEVKAHIQDVHPDTHSLGDLERQGILEAWDKQVAVREYFIFHQLQQRCRASTGNYKQVCIQSGFEFQN